MKTLVTGATGFTGSSLVNKLHESGDKITVIVRDKNKFRQKFGDNYKNIEIVEGSISDPAVVEQAMKDIDRVFNIAAVYRTVGLPESAYWETHVKGTKILLDAAKSHNVKKFVHCSTVGVHGHIEAPPADEEYPFNPGDIYQKTKLEGENLVVDFYNKTKLPVVIIRPTAIYGPGDYRLLKLFKLAAQKLTLVLGKGNIFYHMVHIDDLVDAFILASEKEEAVGQKFIIGSNEVLTLNEILEMIADILNKPLSRLHLPIKPFVYLSRACEKICGTLNVEPIIHERRIHFFSKSRAFDTSKAKSLLEFHPRKNLRAGFTETINWYRTEGLLA